MPSELLWVTRLDFAHWIIEAFEYINFTHRQMPNFLLLIKLYFLRVVRAGWAVPVSFDIFVKLFTIDSYHIEDVWDNYESYCNHLLLHSYFLDDQLSYMKKIVRILLRLFYFYSSRTGRHNYFLCFLQNHK